MGKKRFYAVIKGRNTGVFDQTWDHIRKHVDGYPGAIYKSFSTRGEATTWWVATNRSLATGATGSGPGSKRTRPSPSPGSHDPHSAPSLEPIRPRKLPRQKAEASGPAELIDITSSPPPRSAFTEARDALSDPGIDLQHHSPSTWMLADPSPPYPVHTAPPAHPEDDLPTLFRPERQVEKPSIPLAPEQHEVLQAVLRGENVFFTGPAGSGKSLILKHIQYHLAQRMLSYAVTAPTGLAAALIGGVTINNFFGVGTGERGIRYYLQHSEFSIPLTNKLKETDVLIVDEISMVSPDLWEIVDKIARWRRGDSKMHPQPFGGIQVVACGDFFQLPPVEHEDKKACGYCAKPFPPRLQRKYLKGKTFLDSPLSQNACYFPELIDDEKWLLCPAKNCQWRTNDSVRYVFQSDAWQKLDFKPLILSEVHRQTDKEWVEVLDNVKHSNLTPAVQSYLRKLARPLPNLPNGIRATNLYSHRVDVDIENLRGLGQLPGEEHVFTALDTGCFVPRGDTTSPEGSIPQNMIASSPFNFYFSHLQAPGKLKLKMNAQVMLVFNLSVADQLVNGSRGIVKGFQRFTLSKLVDHMRTEKLSRHHLERWFAAEATDEYVNIPLVSFLPLTGATISGRSMEMGRSVAPTPIFPVPWETTVFVDEFRSATLQRIQLPLILAWATTIHKSQGMTLDYTAVDIRRSFTSGQSYVALSRSRTPDGLSVALPTTSLDRVIMTDAIVERFSELLIRRKGEGEGSAGDAEAESRPIFKQSVKEFKASSRAIDANMSELGHPITEYSDSKMFLELKYESNRGRQPSTQDAALSDIGRQGTGVDDAIHVD